MTARSRRGKRHTNLALLTLLGIGLVSGVVAFGVGSAGPAWVVAVLHGAAGLGLVLLVPWKSLIIRRGWERNPDSRWAGATLAVFVLATVVSGVLHSLGGYREYVGFTPMQIHVGAAAALALALVGHLYLHRQPGRLRRTDLSRRAAVRALTLGGGAGLLYSATEGVAAAAGLPGADRRATGSHETGSFEQAATPIIMWFGDDVQYVDPQRWRLQVHDGGGRRRLGLDELAGTNIARTVLDCTSGWYAEHDWRGVRLDRVIRPGPGARSVDVVSVTGYRRRFPLDDVPQLLLATHMTGQPLTAPHGAPVRLVAPGRRGFWWVKWIDRLEVVDAPWWLQPPFPLQ